MSKKLLNIDNNTKTVKGQKKGYMTAILYLAPADLAKDINVCPAASDGCKKACLNLAGRGRMNMVQKARIRKTLFFHYNKNEFMSNLHKEISSFIKRAKAKDLIPCIRLNGTSDIRWETIDYIDQKEIAHENIFKAFSDVQFYDYTKMLGRKVPKNYHLTFSRSENNDLLVQKALKKGMNVAIVFASKPPNKYKNRIVINGDESDLRFLDGKRKIIGLKAKGKAKKDTSGFVVAA